MDKKSSFEIILMPLVVAIIGIVGTILVTNSQIKSSNTLAEAQQKIKIIEIFSDKITENNESERALAIKVLAAVDPELGQKIASAVQDTDLDVKTKIDDMEISLAKEVQAELKTEVKSPPSKNSTFIVGFYGLDVSDEEFQLALNIIKDSGYTIVTDILLTSRPSWFAHQSTVLYYSNLSKKKATEIANQLLKATNTEFQVVRGKGLGVPKGQEPIRFFIHYVKKE